MKTRFTSHEIAHVWANEKAPHGTSLGAVSFNGPAILSYSTEIGRIVTGKGGRKAYLLNCTYYSNSTSKHQSRVSGAVVGDVFRIDGLRMGSVLRDITGSKLVDYHLRMSLQYLEDAKAPRIHETTRDSKKSMARHHLTEAKRAADFFGVKRKIDEGTIARLAAADARARKEEERIQKEREKRYAVELEERARKVAEDALLWIAGADVSTQFDFPQTLLRREGEEVVTSKGARVPIETGERTFRFVWARRASGWHRNGETHDVSGYPLEAVNEQGIVIGCHRIGWQEVERFATLQGWL